jgi:hypothetical protein
MRRKITNTFTNTNIGIVFKTTTTLHQLIRPTTQIHTTHHEKSGIYKITCNTCQKAYVGQTSWNPQIKILRTQYMKNNDPCSAYALHILNCKHEYGNIDDTMTLLKQINKPVLLLPYEKCIYSHSTTIMNSSLNNIRMNIIPCLNSSNTNTIRHNQHDIKSVIPLIRPVLLNLCTGRLHTER